MIEHNFSELSFGQRESCGDHYCTGHVDKTVRCTCGFTITTEFRENMEKFKREHVFKEIVRGAGIDTNVSFYFSGK